MYMYIYKGNDTYVVRVGNASGTKQTEKSSNSHENIKLFSLIFVYSLKLFSYYVTTTSLTDFKQANPCIILTIGT